MPDMLPEDPFEASVPSERRTRSRHATREHRRRRMRRHGRRAYVRSVYFLPSLATLGNAVCGFGAMYVATLDTYTVGNDPLALALVKHPFTAAAYLIFFAMVFDALDGRLARFTRHTTDFGGQLDSLADVVSFGAAPAFLALQVFKTQGPEVATVLSRLVWALGALYFSCAALRLARFNVSNEHGEQHHYSFLGLPSPGAGGAVVAFILMQQDLLREGYNTLSTICIFLLPLLVGATGLLMVSNVRYPHVVNRYLRGKRSVGRLLFVLGILLLLVVWHQYTLGIGMLVYAMWGPASWAYTQFRHKFHPTPEPPPAPSPAAAP
jgi:CDP-diacylglycerol--serine O-phosphatidyltransferase